MDKDDSYTVAEIFEMLKKDASWEQDPKKREELVAVFHFMILSA